MIARLSGAVTEADATRVAAILAESFDSPAQRWPAASVAAMLAIPGTLALLAPEGCALLRVLAGEAELLTIAVRPAARGRGAGAALLDACLAEAAALGATRLHLEVSVGNRPALALYARAGFVETGRRRGYYAGPAGREDAVTMARDLPQA